MNAAPDVTLYLDPPSQHFLGDRLFSQTDGFHGSQGRAPYVHLQQALTARGIAVHTADLMPDRVGHGRHIYVSMGHRRDYRRLFQRSNIVLSGFFVMEPPVVDPALYRQLQTLQRYFRRIFHWTDSSTLARFAGHPIRHVPFRWPNALDGVREDLWPRTNRKFLAMINVNKLPRLWTNELFTARLRAVEYFSRTLDIDLYGGNWDAPPYRMAQAWMPNTVRRGLRFLETGWHRLRPNPLFLAARRVYRGPVASKIDILGEYTFALCIENMAMHGWVTEKIFDCFFAGTIPVYLGAPDIGSYVPEECFIDIRRFSGFDDLRLFLKSLDERSIQRYKERARAYLQSPQFRPFTKGAFAEYFFQMLREDAGVQIESQPQPC